MDPQHGHHLSKLSELPPQPTDGNHPSTLSYPPDQPTDARARLLSHFQSARGTTEHGQKWDELWEEGFLPWDKGFPNPALVDLLSERPELFPPPPKSGKRKALVPGCGRGYDVLLLSAFGYDAYGLEISNSALKAAREIEKEIGGKGIYEPREGVEKGRVTWLVGDFFADGFLKDVKGEGTFDLIYDYTVSRSFVG
jgi:methyl halide transferase